VVKLNIDALAAVLANVAYIVEKRRTNVDRAFTSTCRRYKCSSSAMSREDFFTLAHAFISNYCLVKRIAEKAGRGSASYRMLARLFIYLWLRKQGVQIDSKLKKSIRRDFGDVDEVYESIDEPWTKLSYPKWIYDKMVSILGREEAEKLLEAMNRRVLWLRINTLRADIDKVLRELERYDVIFEEDHDVPFLVKVLKSKRPLRSLPAVRDGKAIIQDKASVLTVIALNPAPGDLIYDFAAAPGIKTSLIMQLTENRARVVALDRSPRRLESLRALLKKYGVDTTRVDIALTDSRIISLSRRADLALVDAPCSSSGAIPKDPSIKLLLSRPDIPAKMKAIQTAMLNNAVNYADRVVYATCSIFPEEGEEVVLDVISSKDARLEEPKINASPGYMMYPIWSKVRRTLPHINESEGFFIAKLSTV